MGWIEWAAVACAGYLLWLGAKAIDRYENRLRAVERDVGELRRRDR